MQLVAGGSSSGRTDRASLPLFDLNRIDDQRIAFPTANGMSHPHGNVLGDVLWMFAPNPNFAHPRLAGLICDLQQLRALEDLHRIAEVCRALRTAADSAVISGVSNAAGLALKFSVSGCVVEEHLSSPIRQRQIRQSLLPARPRYVRSPWSSRGACSSRTGPSPQSRKVRVLCTLCKYVDIGQKEERRSGRKHCARL